MLPIALGQPQGAHGLPRHVADHRSRRGDVLDDVAHERVVGRASKITRRNQSRPSDFTFPAGERLAVEHTLLEGTHADRIGVDYHAAVFKQDFPAHHVGNAVPFTRPHLRDVMRVDPPAPFELSITPEPQIPVRVGGAPRLDTVVGPAAFVADPDEVENLRDHSCGSPAATLCTG